MMQALSDPPDLATLRELCGQPLPPSSPHSRQHMLRPSRFSLPLEARMVRSIEEIVDHIDKRPLLELLAERDALMQQIVIRAAAGHENAIQLLISSARGVITALQSVEKVQPEKLRAIAEESINWPVLLSPNPQDVEHAKEQVAHLNVGAKATTPRRSGQRLDPRGFWTQIAATVFQVCQDNKVLVPALRLHCAQVKPRRERLNFWNTSISATFYYINPTDCIVITDWEGRCVGLSVPVTTANLKEWWYVMKQGILEYWHLFREQYAAALRQIGNPSSAEYVRRNMALDRIKQAFRSLVGIQ